MIRNKIDQEWEVTPKAAVEIQRGLLAQIERTGTGAGWTSVAGVDVGLKGGIARAAVVVLNFPDLEIIDRAIAERPVSFPYVPGLLSFREAPAILDALARLETDPDVLIFDGQGYAHPRRMGIATHVGILVDHPSVGCAKSRLCGTFEEPGPERGSSTWLFDQDEVIGQVVRTRTRVKPVFVSLGHRLSLEQSVSLVLACGRGYRLPEPTRWAHHFASGKSLA